MRATRITMPSLEDNAASGHPERSESGVERDLVVRDRGSHLFHTVAGSLDSAALRSG